MGGSGTEAPKKVSADCKIGEDKADLGSCSHTGIG